MIMHCYVLDIPTEMFIIITAGIVIIIAVIIITIVIKCTCNNNRTQQESYPHSDANSIPPNYGYTSSKTHQRSSWACTFKGGQQANTHIWETPLPGPHGGEYTLSASMKKQLATDGQPMNTNQNQPANENSGTGGTSRHCHSVMPLNMNQTPVETRIQAQYTMPVKSTLSQSHDDPVVAPDESEYTMPVKSEHTNPKADTANSDNTSPCSASTSAGTHQTLS